MPSARPALLLLAVALSTAAPRARAQDGAASAADDGAPPLLPVAALEAVPPLPQVAQPDADCTALYDARHQMIRSLRVDGEAQRTAAILGTAKERTRPPPEHLKLIQKRLAKDFDACLDKVSAGDLPGEKKAKALIQKLSDDLGALGRQFEAEDASRCRVLADAGDRSCPPDALLRERYHDKAAALANAYLAAAAAPLDDARTTIAACLKRRETFITEGLAAQIPQLGPQLYIDRQQDWGLVLRVAKLQDEICNASSRVATAFLGVL